MAREDGQKWYLEEYSDNFAGTGWNQTLSKYTTMVLLLYQADSVTKSTLKKEYDIITCDY
jgi:hypothetical protein